MTTYTWPEGRTFEPAAATLRVRHNQERFSESPLSGAVQTLAMPGSRWGWQLDWPGSLSVAEAAELEAMVVRLSGRQHRVRLWDFKRPRPQGDIRPVGVTLGAAASQFATSLQLAGCRGQNLLLGSDFELDTDADGVCNHWLAYQTGTTGAITRQRDTSTAYGSGSSQRVLCAALGTAATDTAGVVQIVPVTGAAGTPFSLGVYAWGNASQKMRLFVQLWKSGVSGQVVIDSEVDLNTSWQRFSASGIATQDFDQAFVYFWQRHRAGSSGAATFYVDKAQLEISASASSYVPGASVLAGDWMSVQGQLLMAAATSQANDNGELTVEVRHMLRAAVPSGTAVVLDKPTGLFMLADGTTAFQRVPGQRGAPLSLEFIEVFS